MTLFDHAVVDGHILFTSYIYDDDDEDVHDLFKAYNPTSNTKFKVENKTSDVFLEFSSMRFEVDEVGRCFLLRELHGRN